MVTDYQAALIRRIKSRLRQEAGIPSFDPSEPCPQSEPTLEEVVAGNDPSPPELRCWKCRGRLLAGIRSHVCIYCGAQQRNDVSPPSMSFTSTFTYRGFLRSLQLDGSEIVSPDISTEHSIGHHATTKKEILLSELLDFELKWPQVTEVADGNHENKVQFPHTNYTNLTNVNLENFCTISKPEIVVHRPNVLSTSDLSNEMISISSKEFNFEAFEKIGGKAMVDTIGPNGSSWKAEFQTAASGSQTTDANVTGSLSPTVTNFVSTSKPVGEDLKNELQFARENKNKAEEPNESWIGDTGGIFYGNFSGEPVFNHVDDTSGVSTFDSSAASTAANTKETVNMLTSEMHDLSFMLKSELSHPVKRKNSG